MTFTLSGEGTRLAKDGVSRRAMPHLVPQRAMFPRQILLGDSPGGKSPWDGIIRKVDMRDGSGNILYSMEGAKMDIPFLFRPLAPEVLSWPWKGSHLTRSFLSDAILNVLGFIPLGILLFLLLPGPAWSRVALGVVLGASLSLALELLQVLLPSRDSSLSDFILNTAGTLLGAVWAKKKARPKRDWPKIKDPKTKEKP